MAGESKLVRMGTKAVTLDPVAAGHGRRGGQPGGRPSILGGTGLYAFYSAAGWMTYIGQLALVSRFLIASISMVWKQEAAAPSPLERHATNLLGLNPDH